MVWAILAAIPLFLLFVLYLVRFRYHVEYESPATLRVSAGAHFLWWGKVVSVEPGRAVWGKEWDDGDHESGMPPDDLPGPAEARPGERGALRLPDFLTARLIRARVRARKAATKWVLEPGVWRLLLAFLWRSGRRALWLVNPRMETAHFALQDCYSLGRLAGVWSVLSGIVPALACKTTYGFGAEEASLKVRGGGRFTALGVLTLLLMSVTTFPWAGLASKFAQCWRDPGLARWQRRVLLP